MKAVLVFDADNTLWDTDSIFRSAQTALLQILSKSGFVDEPETHVETLRVLDRELFRRMGRFEYNFKVLSKAATYYFAYRLHPDEAVNKAVCTAEEDSCELAGVINDAYSAYEKCLMDIPELYPDTELVLSSISVLRKLRRSLATVLLSEGEPKRLHRILEFHKIGEKFFDNVVVEETKSLKAFEKAKCAGLEYLDNARSIEETILIIVGDSLRRDIKFGNQLGFVTVYKPAPFMGKEEPQELDENPTYTINRLAELPSLLENMGFPIHISV